MGLVDLYKHHINKDADASEIHQILSTFGIGIVIGTPDSPETYAQKTAFKEAEDWILKNSKLDEDRRKET